MGKGKFDPCSGHAFIAYRIFNYSVYFQTIKISVRSSLSFTAQQKPCYTLLSSWYNILMKINNQYNQSMILSSFFYVPQMCSF